MAEQNKIRLLERQVQQLQVDKLELIRSTSTEIERLRQIIRVLTDPNLGIQTIDDLQLEYEPLSSQEKDRLAMSSGTAFLLQQQARLSSSSLTIPTEMKDTPGGMDTDQPNPSTEHTDESLSSALKDATTGQNVEKNGIAIQQWGGNPNRSLGSLREEKTYEYNSTSQTQQQLADSSNNNHNNIHNNSNNNHSKSGEKKKGHRSEESIFRLNTKRMSYKGFEFGDFGFMTTDFDQLSRGHTQWVNQVMHHPVQNGIVITASDDWCVMFWRFKKNIGSDELKQERLHHEMKRSTQSSNIQPTKQNNYYIDPKLQHIAGEIELLPVLKINTGLEVKAIAMSSNGRILACTCYDEEEDEGNPELQLYFDTQQRWTFKHHQFNPYFSSNMDNNGDDASEYMDDHVSHHSHDDASTSSHTEHNAGRLISRRIVSLPFEPIPHCITFTRDNKYVFVAMYSSQTILKELNEELEEEYGGREHMDEEALSKWPDHPISLCCVHVQTQKIRECEKIWPYLGEDEHVQCMAISSSGARIAIGTSLGQLIVTGVMNLTDDVTEDEDDYNPMLQKIWSSNMLSGSTSNITPEASGGEEDRDGSITAMDWSPDSNWIVCGHASGVIKFWKRNEKTVSRRLSTQLNRTINQWMNSAKVQRKIKMFECKWYLEGLHNEAINSLSIRGTMMVTGADDGNVIVYDLLRTFVDGGNESMMNNQDEDDSSPITMGRIDKIHGGRMVNSVALTKNYSEKNLLIPSNAHFMVTSGADNIVHCVSIMDVCRETIRRNHKANLQKAKDV